MVGYCPACGSALAIGQLITRVAGKPGWFHTLCCSGDGPQRTGETLYCAQSYYVSVTDPDNPRRRGLLMGPYETPEEAYSAIPEARDRANAVNSWSCFYAFGIASGPVQPTMFGNGL